MVVHDQNKHIPVLICLMQILTSSEIYCFEIYCFDIYYFDILF